tara:strand:- start:7130 stop:7264 length:135 start_codon:yes stop_codon:yes gene_type:complete
MDNHKFLHIKSLILNFLVDLMKADTEDKFKKEILEISTIIHKAS